MRQIRPLASHLFLALLESALIASLLVGLVAAPALAAKGGGGKPGGTSGSTATVAVTPNPVGVGVSYTISGTGYKAGAPLDVKLYSSTATTVLFTGADTTGSFSMANKTWTAGSIRVEVWQYAGSWSLKATTSFSVTP